MEVDNIEKDDVNDGPALEVLISVEISNAHILVYQHAFPSMQDEQGLSTHEKGLLKMRNQIDLMEKASLEPSKWIMQGEVADSMFWK